MVLFIHDIYDVWSDFHPHRKCKLRNGASAGLF